MKTLKKLLGLVLLWPMALWLAGSQPARCEAAQTEDNWYLVLLAATPVGAVHETILNEHGATVFVQQMDIALNRLGTKVEMGSRVESREDAAGLLLSVAQELDVSSQATRFEALVEPGVVRIRDRAGAGEFAREIAYEGELLGPTGVRDLIRDRLLEVGDRVSYQTFRPELASVAKVSLEMVARETVTRDGEELPAKKILETLADTPLQTTAWIGAGGELLRSAAVSPFGLMEVVWASETAARLAMDGGELPSESYSATMAPTQVRIREPRATRRVVLELRHRNPDLGWPDMTSDAQRVLAASPVRLVLEVVRPQPSGSATFPVDSAGELEPYLRPNAYLQSDDPEMRQLAVSIAGERGDALEAALALERWVAENMSFDMGVVMAPSNEVLENRRGTCTEYAVLLTTLARSLGIPARFVMGYVYAGGIYGGHAWTEIRVGEHWIPLDGAIVSAGSADAARFAFQWSSLAEGIGALNLGPGVQMFGQIDLSVLEVEWTDGTVARFDADATLFEIEGDRYVNEPLGLEWHKPDGFEFADLESTWPETGLVGLIGPNGERAELSVRDRYFWEGAVDAARQALGHELPGVEVRESSLIGGGLQAAGGREAALAWTRGTELWTLSVESPTPAADLERLASTLVFTF